ncbi:MAG: hypothetical protein ACRD0H_02295, partial [Actinomycetes bacterium]
MNDPPEARPTSPGDGTLDLVKYHGLGNDFLILLDDRPRDAARSGEPDLAALATRVCDRHRGIGAD